MTCNVIFHCTKIYLCPYPTLDQKLPNHSHHYWMGRSSKVHTWNRRIGISCLGLLGARSSRLSIVRFDEIMPILIAILASTFGLRTTKGEATTLVVGGGDPMNDQKRRLVVGKFLPINALSVGQIDAIRCYHKATGL